MLLVGKDNGIGETRVQLFPHVWLTSGVFNTTETTIYSLVMGLGVLER